MAAPHARATPEKVAPAETVEVDPLRNPERRRRAAQASAIDIACGAQSDSYVIPAAAAVIAPYVAAAQHGYGPLPPVRSEEWLNAPDAVKLASLLTLGVAYLVADPHRVVRNALKQCSDDVHGGDHRLWRGVAADLAYKARREGAA